MTDATKDDLQKMPLLDHLIELRTRLLYSVGALVVAFIGAWFLSEDIYRFLVKPLADILLEIGVEQGEARRMIFTNLTEVFFTYVKEIGRAHV